MGEPGSILVLPRVEPLAGPSGSEGPAVGRRSMGLGELAAGGEREAAADPELDGVRSYRPGTKATRIYWPSLARGMELAERHLVAAGDAAPLIVLDPSGADAEEDLDRAVRAAASLMAHLARLGGCELLIAGTRQRLSVGRDPRAWTAALAALAVVDSRDGVPRLAHGDLRSAVIWVGASPAPRLPAGVDPRMGRRPGAAPRQARFVHRRRLLRPRDRRPSSRGRRHERRARSGSRSSPSSRCSPRSSGER